MRRSRESGFTLIELLVVIMLIGILMGFALPNYAGYLEKTRRSDARVALLEMASVQERVYFERNQYSGTVGDVWTYTDGADSVSAEGHYVLTVALTGGDTNRFTATATARGKQSGDEDCVTMTIDETGLRNATAAAGGDKTVCW